MRRFVFIVLLLLLSIVPARAQNDIVLSITVPELLETFFIDNVIEEFEAATPGVRVNIVPTEGLGSPFNPGDPIEDYLDDVAGYVSEADVVLIDSTALDPAVTRAGYLLDLAPLVNSDPGFNQMDFFQPVLESFRWDGGLWGVPVSADAVVLFYDPVVFDEVGLPYPTPQWTIFDLDNAIRRIVTFDEQGRVTRPGFINLTGNLESLFVSLLGQGLYDPATFPLEPDYSNPELENLLTIWHDLQVEGFLNPPVTEDGDFTFGTYPLEIGQAGLGNLQIGGEGDVNRQAVLLPGGGAGLAVNGFAISAGTQYPDLAYELVKYLSNSVEVSSAFFSGKPARQSLVGLEPDQAAPFSLGASLPPQIDATLTDALSQGTPTSELLFADVVNDALALMRQDDLTPREALDQLRDDEITRLQAADARFGESITIAQRRSLDLPTGETALNFGVVSFVSPLPNQEAWDSIAAEFAGREPGVGLVEIDRSFPTDLEALAERYDCFYTYDNLIPQANDISPVINLDPLLAADPALTVDSFVAGTLPQVQRDGITYGVPLSVQPLVMRYNPVQFTNAGAILPFSGWTTAEFEQALRALQRNNPDVVPYQPVGLGGAYIYNLIAAYGGQPIDYSTIPPTLNFADPVTVEAIRQVLELAKEGLIAYEPLIATGGGFAEVDPDTVPLTSESLDELSAAFAADDEADANQPPPTESQIVAFPRGSTLTPVSYSLSVAYISAGSQQVEACYRFISDLTRRPDLIETMPANTALLDDPTLASAQGQVAVDYYRELQTILNAPDTVVIPQQGGISLALLDTFWINQVFDDYVLEEDGPVLDLAFRLEEAQDFTEAFRGCTADLPPLRIGEGNPLEYYNQVRDCAVRVDPNTAEFFPEISS